MAKVKPLLIVRVPLHALKSGGKDTINSILKSVKDAVFSSYYVLAVTKQDQTDKEINFECINAKDVDHIDIYNLQKKINAELKQSEKELQPNEV